MKTFCHKSTTSRLLRFPGLAICLLCALVSCKDEDGSPPSISVTNPVDGDLVVACDEVRITGRATDNRGLSQVTATLIEPFTNQILGSSSVAVDGVEADFAFNLKMGDRYTPSGEYQLRVTATDAAGNAASDFVLPQLSELPRQFIQAAWAGVNSTQGTTLFLRDSLGQFSTGPFLGTDLADLEIDNRSQQLLVAERLTGRFDGRNLEDLSLIFREDLPVGTQVEGITSISAATNRFYLSLVVPPYVRVFDLNGTQISAWDQALHPGYEILASPDRVWLSVEGFAANPVKVDVYAPASQQLTSANPLGWRATQLLLVDDLLLACGNSGNQGRVYLLDADNLLPESELDLTEAFLAADGAGTDWFVLLASGVWRLDLASGNLSGPIVNGNYTSLAYEEVSGNLWLGGQDVVEIYTSNGMLLQSLNGNYGTVSWIDFNYNK